MLPRIETSEVIRRATLAFDQHNRNCPEVTRMSNRANGPIAVTRRVGLIPEAVTTTFHTILTEYIQDYNRMRQLMPLHLQDPATPPSLHTNAGRIAKYARCTDRTVRNHLRRLKELGFVETKFHGSKSNFELWIKPKYLFGEAEPKTAKIGLQSAPETPERKIFPHSSTYGEIFEKEKGSADMLIQHGESIHGEKGRTEAADPSLHDGDSARREDKLAAGGAAGDQQKEPLTAKERQAATVSWADARAKERDARRPKAPRGIDPKYLQILFDFWFYAWKVLYPSREFSKEEQEKALSAISAGVFENFQGDWTDQQWFDYKQIQMAKVAKAGLYYDNHPDAYKPDPYAVHIPGKGYFDAANLKGFIGIDAWIKKDAIKHARSRQAYADKQEAKTRRAETLLRTARRDFEKLSQNMKPRKEVAKFNQIALFQYYNSIFGGLGKKWQDAFCRQYLEQQSRGFKTPDYYRFKKQRGSAGETTTIVHVEPWMGSSEGYYTD